MLIYDSARFLMESSSTIITWQKCEIHGRVSGSSHPLRHQTERNPGVGRKNGRDNTRRKGANPNTTSRSHPSQCFWSIIRRARSDIPRNQLPASSTQSGGCLDASRNPLRLASRFGTGYWGVGWKLCRGDLVGISVLVNRGRHDVRRRY